MKENQTEHTFIVTVDAASARHAEINSIALSVLQGILFLNGMTAAPAFTFQGRHQFKR